MPDQVFEHFLAGETLEECYAAVPPSPCVSQGVYSLVPDQVFEHFLAGETLEECYAAVAAVADRWLDLLDTQARHLPPCTPSSFIAAPMSHPC